MHLTEIPHVRKTIEDYYIQLLHNASSAHKRKEVKWSETLLKQYQNFLKIYYRLGYPYLNHVELIASFEREYDNLKTSKSEQAITTDLPALKDQKIDSSFLEAIIDYRDKQLFGSILKKFNYENKEERRKFWKFIDGYDEFLSTAVDIFGDRSLLKLQIDE
jgi:hypothetical protein